MFPDFIRDTEIYQYIMQEGREQGIEQGREQEREQAKQRELQHLRQILVSFVQAHSPELVPLTQKKAEAINSIETLNALVLNMCTAQSLADVRRCLEEAEDK